MAYNPVPGYPNCFYDTVKKEHVWTLINTSTRAWVGTVRGYAKNNCLDARAAFIKASGGGSTRTPTPKPTKQTNNCTPSNCFAKAQTDKGALLAPCTHQVVCWQSPRPNGAIACIEGGGIDEHGCPMGIRVNCDTCTRARAKWLAENKGGVPAIQGYPSGTKGGTGASPQCGGCGPLDMGCEIGKQFCEFQSWISKNVGGAAVPVLVAGSMIVAIFVLKR